MTVDAVASSGLYSGQTPTRAPKQTLDSEVFMTLLVAQLRNQDPSSPMDTNEMMSQQTALASLEQVTNMNEVSQEQFALTMRMAALGIVGQQVSYTATDGTVISGTASAASFAASVPSITIDGESVALDKILSVQTTGA